MARRRQRARREMVDDVGGTLGGGRLERLDALKKREPKPRREQPDAESVAKKAEKSDKNDDVIDVSRYDANDPRKQRVALSFGDEKPSGKKKQRRKKAVSPQKKPASPSIADRLKSRGVMDREGLGYLQGGAPLDEAMPRSGAIPPPPDWTADVAERVFPLGYPTNVALGLAGTGAALPLGPLVGGALGGMSGTLMSNPNADAGDYLESAAMGAGLGQLGSAVAGAVAPQVRKLMRPAWEKALPEILDAGGQFRRPNLGGGMPPRTSPMGGPTIDVQAEGSAIPLPGSQPPAGTRGPSPSSSPSPSPPPALSPGLTPMSPGRSAPMLSSGSSPTAPPAGRTPLPRAGDQPIPAAAVPREPMSSLSYAGKDTIVPQPPPMPGSAPRPVSGPTGTGVDRPPGWAPPQGPSLPFSNVGENELFRQGAIDLQGRVVPRFDFGSPGSLEMSAIGPGALSPQPPPPPGSMPRVPAPRAPASIGGPPAAPGMGAPAQLQVGAGPTPPSPRDRLRELGSLPPSKQVGLLLSMLGLGSVGAVTGEALGQQLGEYLDAPIVEPLPPPPTPRAIPRPRAVPPGSRD